MQNFVQSIKNFIKNTKDKFKALDKNKRYAIIIGIVAIVLATVFSISYGIKNKYGILFSGLDSYDAANISKVLEDKKLKLKLREIQFTSLRNRLTSLDLSYHQQ